MYITDVPSDNFIIQHTDNTVICQVRTSRVAVEDEEAEEAEEGAEGEAAAEGAEAPAEA